jgi:hypothetical protein
LQLLIWIQDHTVDYFLLLYHLQPISAFSLYHLRVFCDITFDDLVPCDSEYERCTEYHEHMAPSCLFLFFPDLVVNSPRRCISDSPLDQN